MTYEPGDVTKRRAGRPTKIAKKVRKPITSPSEDNLPVGYATAARFIALRIHERLPSDLSLQEIYRAALAGLLHAAKTFNPSKRSAFGDFVCLCIRKTILERLRSPTLTPSNLHFSERVINEAIQASAVGLSGTKGNNGTVQNINTQLAGQQRQLSEPGLPAEGRPLHAGHTRGCEEEQHVVYLPNRAQSYGHLDFKYDRMRQRLTDAISNLPENEWLVLALYYYDESSVKDIGLILGISESHASKLHASAVLQVRKSLVSLTYGSSHST